MNGYVLGFMRFLSEGLFPLLFWVLIIFGFDKVDVAVLTILSALIHEIGHITAILVIKRDTGRLLTHISGFRIQNDARSYKEELFVLISGPFVNILLFIISSFSHNALNGYITLFGYINLVTAISNLLPVEGYDGYGILTRLVLLFGWLDGVRVLEYISFSVTVIITFFSLYLLFYYGEGYWVFGVFFTLMLARLSSFIKEDILRE